MKVYQIHYEDSQVGSLDYIPYRNEACTLFFENSVIRSLVASGEHKGTDYFGVVSHKLRSKLSFTKRWPLRNIANQSGRAFTPEHFEMHLRRSAPDAMSFQRHLEHDPVSYADRFHPHFSEYFRRIMAEIGFAWKPTHLTNVFYCNYFVARPEIYEAYVKEMLAPAMDVMEGMPELMANSGYPHPLPDHLKEAFGISHYPYHPFLCERMFSFFAHVKKLKCLHY